MFTQMNRFGEYTLPRAYPKPTKTQKRRSRKRRLFLFLFSLLLFALLLFIHFQKNVTRVLLSISEATMRASTTIAVNDAVYYTLSDEMRYEDLVTVTRSGNGDILAVAANPLKINKIARDTASISQSKKSSAKT